MTLQAGRQLGPDQIDAPLDEGGMGEVYQARPERDVALNVPHLAAADNSGRRD